MLPFEKLRFGSVCSGIEAASVAFAPLNWEAAWLAEVDVAASQVLAYRLGATAPVYPLAETEKAISRLKWGDRITNYGDMTVLAALVRARKVEAPDILCGGTPCQSFSVAGLRGGLNDARGQLTLAFIDLANAIDEIRAEDGLPPVIIIWENVPGVLSHADNPLGCFLAGLAGDDDALEPGPRPEPARSSAYWAWDKASGQHRAKWPDAGAAVGPQRAVGWRIGDAQHFGLPQRRRRIFVVASAREGFDPAAILLEFDGVRRDSPPSREAWQEVAGTLDARTDGGGFPGSDGAAQYHVVPHGLESGRSDGSVGLRPDGTQPLYYQHDWAHGRVYGVDGVSPALTCGNEAGGKNILAPTWWDGSPISQTLDAVLYKGQTMPEKNRFPAVLQPVEPELYSIMPMNSGKDYKTRKVEVTQPLMGAGPVGGNQGGDFVVQSVALRGRDGGATAELGGEQAGTLRASGGGGDKPYVLAPTIAFSCKDYGADAVEDIAPTMRAMGHSGSHANAGGQLAVCVTGEIAHTLKVDGFDASEDGTGRCQPIVVHGTQDPDINVGFAHPLGRNHGGENVLLQSTMAVRRPMPIECHRLQGFPDVLEWKFDEMTRDEVILAALMNGDIIVDAERGKVFGTRGPGGILLSEPRELGCTNPVGYRVANLTANGVKRQVRLHRVVWMSVYGAIPDDLVPDHINNDKADNRIANLQLLTRGENSTKAKDDGLYDFDDAAHTKLTAEVRAQVWRDYHSGGVTYRDLAVKYGVSPSRIGQIATQEPWCAVPTGPKGDKIAADGPQYKQLGNSWAVNHARWVGYRIAMWLAANPPRPVIEMQFDEVLLIWAMVD